MNNQNNTTQLQESLSSQKVSSLPNTIELLKQSLNIYKQNLEALLMIVLLLTIFSFVAVEYGNFIPTPNISNFEKSIIGIIIFLINFIFPLWSFCAIIYLIRDNFKKIDLTEAYRQTFKLIPSLLWLSFLGVFIILGSFVFLIIPGIIFGIWFVLGPYVLVNENLKGMNALLKSREYIRGYWWKVLWRLLALGVFFLIVSLVLGFIVNLFLSLLLSKNITNYVNEFMSALIGSFFFSFQIVYTFLIYKNLQSIKGEFSFEPSKSQKLKYILVGVVGIIVFLILIFYILSLFLRNISF